jgi:hypothetical protein
LSGSWDTSKQLQIGPPEEADKALKKLTRHDELDRIACESKFDEGNEDTGLT